VKNFFAVWSYVLTAGFTARGPGTTGRLYLFSEVFDLKPTSGLYLKNSAHLSNFLTPRTVSADHLGQESPAQGHSEDQLPNVSPAVRESFRGKSLAPGCSSCGSHGTPGQGNVT
jgi:hypothetical protein